jgi:hypothetical protein
MKPKTKKTPSKKRKIISKIFWIIWILIGFSTSLFTSLVYNKMNSTTGMGIVGWVIQFTIGVYLLFLYAGITLLILLIKFIIRVIKRGKKRK